ncbi:hypothetical protein OG218_02910 [Kineococcus sp. NBC_00420]|uniref:hypothetical protein n=1 Tax=Kineococcus sp. NBC_00420 TaxID=2903564 RepID=UPI002E1D7ADE
MPNLRNQGQYTWRSALGVDRHGNLLRVAGDELDLVHLAGALVQAGAVRAMELDMHTGMVSSSRWDSSGSVVNPRRCYRT